MILVVDRDPHRGATLAAYLAREGGFAATSAPAPPPPEPQVSVAVVCVTSEVELDWVGQVRTLTQAARVLALTPDPLRVVAFERGADDVTQLDPLSPREVTLRIRGLWRRAPRETAPSVAVRSPDWMREEDSAVRVGDRWIPLTRVEYALLAALAAWPGRVVPRQRIVERVWGAATQERTVDSTVKRLRLRLGTLGAAIETVRGVGYRFDEARFGGA